MLAPYGRTSLAPGETTVTRCLHLSSHGLKAAILLCVPLVFAAGMAAQAQVVASAMAEDLCLRPPMEAHERDRLRRRGDFMHLLTELADDCPDVAMIFIEFEVGSIDGRDAHETFDFWTFVPPLPWPQPSDRNF